MTDFKFLDLTPSSDGTIDLVLEKLEPGDPVNGHVPQYHFGIARHGVPGNVGTIRFRVGTAEQLPFPGHIGYEVDPSHRGNHYAEKACRILAPLVRAHGFSSVLLTCRPDNLASRRTMERLGARLLGQFEVPATHEMYPKYAKDGGAPILRFEWRVEDHAPRA